MSMKMRTLMNQINVIEHQLDSFILSCMFVVTVNRNNYLFVVVPLVSLPVVDKVEKKSLDIFEGKGLLNQPAAT